MKDPLLELEEELRELTPDSVPESLLSRLEGELDTPAGPAAQKAAEKSRTGHSGIIRFSLLLAAGLLIAITLKFTILQQKSDPPERGTEIPSIESGIAFQEEAGNKLINESDVMAEVADTAGFQPVESENFLIEAVEEGIVMNEDQNPARKFRYNFVDTITWRNPSDGASIKLAIPREEIVLVPLTTF